MRACLGFLVGLLCPSTQCLCRSDKHNNNTSQASSPAWRPPSPAAHPGRDRPRQMQICVVCLGSALAILHTCTPSNHHPPSPHDSHTTQYQHGPSLGARRTTLPCALPSCLCFGTARTSARLVLAPTPTPTPSRQPRPTLAHHAGPPGNAKRNTSRPALLLRPFGTASPSRCPPHTLKQAAHLSCRFV